MAMRDPLTLSVLQEPLSPRSITRQASQFLPGQLPASPCIYCRAHTGCKIISVQNCLVRMKGLDGELFRLVSQAERRDGDSYQSQYGLCRWRGRIVVTFQLWYWTDMILRNVYRGDTSLMQYVDVCFRNSNLVCACGLSLFKHRLL